MTDPGADDNLMLPHVLELLLRSAPNLKIETIEPKLEFKLAVLDSANGQKAIVTCSRKVIADVNLRIRHGNELILRSVVWIVSDQEAEFALIGRPILESLGINARNILEAFSDEHDGEVYVPNLLQSEHAIQHNNSPPKLASLLRDGIFHSHGGEEDECIEDGTQFLDFGEDDPQDVDASLDQSIKDSANSGLSERGVQRLTRMLHDEFRNIFRLRLGKAPPAKLPPMRIKIKEGAIPVKVKVRRYPTDQREFINSHIDKLVEIGILQPNKLAHWQCAPLIVPKPQSKEK